MIPRHKVTLNTAILLEQFDAPQREGDFYVGKAGGNCFWIIVFGANGADQVFEWNHEQEESLERFKQKFGGNPFAASFDEALLHKVRSLYQEYAPLVDICGKSFKS